MDKCLISPSPLSPLSPLYVSLLNIANDFSFTPSDALNYGSNLQLIYLPSCVLNPNLLTHTCSSHSSLIML